MIVVTGTFRILPGGLIKAMDAMERMIQSSRAESGCIQYAYAVDLFDDCLIHVSEKWQDAASLDAHLKSTHLQQWRAQYEQLGIHDRNLFRYHADKGQSF